MAAGAFDRAFMALSENEKLPAREREREQD
jgi:hypothetical protein